MGVAKKRRTIDYFKRQGDAEIKARVDELVKKCKAKKVESKEESQDETEITVAGG